MVWLPVKGLKVVVGKSFKTQVEVAKELYWQDSNHERMLYLVWFNGFLVTHDLEEIKEDVCIVDNEDYGRKKR